ncbi:hypothetical protein [Piscirickettsia litoralis]|uniref:Uncharacterized protein n=1 Tax=Piscirickettsia litoralis TaxID=1891921 RepID=A0ABX3A2H9_9GAMM|nr:hypothetical protein [Piscirickettsia litoralis]ODN41585.1 hypothetical protein BGC07_15910 [Piscirickettsia litoralis]
MLNQLNNTNLTRAERRKRAAWYRSKELLRWRFIAEYGVGNEVTEIVFDIKATAKDALNVASEKVVELVQEDYGNEMDGPEWIKVREFVSF